MIKTLNVVDSQELVHKNKGDENKKLKGVLN